MQNYIILLSIILILTIIYYAYILGKTKQENKQYKSNNKLQKKINKVKSINNKKELINRLKKNKFIWLLFMLVGCSSLNNSNLYIPLQNYTKEEQKELAEFLEKNNNQLIDKVIMDYGDLRERVRVVNGE